MRLSVWDQNLTTVSQAKAFRTVRTTTIAIENHELIGLARERSYPSLRAVYDSLPWPDTAKPGAAGHAGIEGLGRGGGLNKAQRAALRDPGRLPGT